MTLLDFLIFFLVAAICGAVAQALTGFSRGGLFVSIALGFIGALVGVALARNLAAPEILAITVGDAHFPIAWSIIGATLFLVVLRLLTLPGSRA